ncbi:hypothetical protein KC19_1G030300 [Ceratodon purpureus]|uniref:Ubiquitin-like protein ATG12 n=1 Tax=Ceratodon purpureus TaxID=3225 RepID=A0A8T0J3S0_CERPU|nr:hypothetical protein KC19_1G030300 [Ceratodon purpureus]
MSDLMCVSFWYWQFLYIDSKFSPTPDENIGDMFENFGTKGMLIVNYAFSMAWG